MNPRRIGVVLIALVLALFGCGGDGDAVTGADPEPATATAARATVAQILEDPDAFAAEPAVEVPGEARRIGDLGFLLADEGRVLFVGAPASDLDRLEDGERVTVRGELSQLSETRAETIADALDGQPEALEPRFDAWPKSVGPDKPILNLRVLEGARASAGAGSAAATGSRALAPGRRPSEGVANARRLAGQEVGVTGEIDVLADGIMTLGHVDLHVAGVRPHGRSSASTAGLCCSQNRSRPPARKVSRRAMPDGDSDRSGRCRTTTGRSPAATRGR